MSKTTWPEILDVAISGRLRGLWTACPGVVQAYDVTTQSATVRLAATVDGETLDLQDVRIGHLRAGGVTFHSPIGEGSAVLVIFAGLDADAWRTTGAIQEPAEVERLTAHTPIAIPVESTDPDAIAAGVVLGANPAIGSSFVVTSGGTAAPVARADVTAIYLTAILGALQTLGVTFPPMTDPRNPLLVLPVPTADVGASTLQAQ